MDASSRVASGIDWRSWDDGKLGRYQPETPEGDTPGKLGVLVRLRPGGFRLKLMVHPGVGWGVRFMGRPWLPSTTLGVRTSGSATGLGTHQFKPVQGGAPGAAVGGWNQRVLTPTGSPTPAPCHALLSTTPR